MRSTRRSMLRFRSSTGGLSRCPSPSLNVVRQALRVSMPLTKNGPSGLPELPSVWQSCGALRIADRRVAFVLTNSSAKASQVGGAVGSDTPASLLLTTLRADERADVIRSTALPETSDELMDRLLGSEGLMMIAIHSIRHRRSVFHERHIVRPSRAFPERARAKNAKTSGGNRRSTASSVRPLKPKTDKSFLVRSQPNSRVSGERALGGR